MNEFEALRLIGEVLAITTFIGSFLWKVVLMLRQVLSKLEGVTVRLDTINGSIAHLKTAEIEWRERVAHLEGKAEQRLET